MGPEIYTYIDSKFVEWFLHAKDVKLRNGFNLRIYYFCKDKRINVVENMPDGFYVVESRTGLPLLKKNR